MNNGKKHIVWLTIDEIEKVKSIIPDIEFKLQIKKERRPYSINYYWDNREKILKKQRKKSKSKKRVKNVKRKTNIKQVAKKSNALCLSRGKNQSKEKSGRIKKDKRGGVQK